MSDASAEVSETESAKGKDKRRSARVAGAAAAKAQLAKLKPTHSADAGGESTSDRPPAAAKAASKKGKKADEPRPEPAQPVQPAQPEPERPSFVYNDSTPGQLTRAFGFSEQLPGARPGGAFNTRPSDRPPPSYRLMEPRLPSEREQRQPEQRQRRERT